MLIRRLNLPVRAATEEKKKGPESFIFFFSKKRTIIIACKIIIKFKIIHIYIKWMHYQPLEFIVHKLDIYMNNKINSAEVGDWEKRSEMLEKEMKFLSFISTCLALPCFPPSPCFPSCFHSLIPDLFHAFLLFLFPFLSFSSCLHTCFSFFCKQLLIVIKKKPSMEIWQTLMLKRKTHSHVYSLVDISI